MLLLSKKLSCGLFGLVFFVVVLVGFLCGFFFLFFVCFDSSERFPWPLILQAEPVPNIHFSSNSLFTKIGICIRETLRRFSFFYFK